MVLFNYSTKELTAKVVYYGPGLCGKTTNLQYIHGNLPANVKGKMLSLATKTDRTLFFDFLPIDLGHIRGMKTRVQLYTVPGQVFYNETRKLVLKGADGIVFVADSQKQMLNANVESFKNLEENLKTHGLSLAEMPHVIQFNKRDLPTLATIEELNAAVNRYNAPFYESVATTGIGVQDTLKAITKLVLVHLTKKYDPKAKPKATAHEHPAVEPVAEPPAAAAVEAPPAQTQRIPIAAMSSPGQTQAIPLSPEAGPAAASAAASVDAQPAEEWAAAAPAARETDGLPAQEPRFGDDEINELVEEVDELTVSSMPAEPPLVADRPAFEIDDSAVALEEEPSVGLGAGAPPEAAPVDQSFEFDRKLDPEWGAEAEQATGDVAQDHDVGPIAADGMEEEPEALEAAAIPQPEGLAPVEEPSPPHPGAGETGEALHEPPAAEYEPAVPAADEPTPSPEQPLAGDLAEGSPAAGVTLSELASDEDLFEDPSLEVARVAAGQEREIVIPLETSDADAESRRYKLTVKLRLDPVD